MIYKLLFSTIKIVKYKPILKNKKNQIQDYFTPSIFLIYSRIFLASESLRP
jgi:hypothetical protein